MPIYRTPLPAFLRAFTEYECKSLDVTEVESSVVLNQKCLSILVINEGNSPCDIKFNKNTNDAVRIVKGDGLGMDLEVTIVFAKCDAGRSTKIVVMGLRNGA